MSMKLATITTMYDQIWGKKLKYFSSSSILYLLLDDSTNTNKAQNQPYTIKTYFIFLSKRVETSSQIAVRYLKLNIVERTSKV